MKLKIFFIVSFIAIYAICAKANLVRNPNFNEKHNAVSISLVAGDNIGAWVVDHGSVDIVAKCWTPRHHLMWTGVRGPHSIDMGGSLPCRQRDGSIHQNLVTVPGDVYQVRFALAGNCFGPPTVKKLILKWNDSFAKTFTFDTTGHTNDNMGWTYCTLTLRANSEITRLTFDNPINTSYGPVIDDVSVEPVSDGEMIGRPAIQVSGKSFDLSWASVANERYQVQWTDSLSNPRWQNLGDPVPGTGGVISMRGARINSQKFYRVVILH